MGIFSRLLSRKLTLLTRLFRVSLVHAAYINACIPITTTNERMPWVQHVTPEVAAVSLYPTILWVCGSLTFFMLLVVALRTYLRIARVKNFGTDDTLVLGGAVSRVSKL